MNEIDPKISRLYREGAREGPPPALDAAILAAARAQAAQRAPRKRSAWLRWMAPASALATLVLGVSVALLVQREQVIPEAVERMNQSAPQPQSAPAASGAETAQSQAADRAAPAAAARKAAPAAAPAPAQLPQVPAAAKKSSAEAFPAERRAPSAAPAPAGAAAQDAGSANGARETAAGRMQAGAPAAAAGRLAPLREDAAPRDPAAWLEEIRRLRQQGRAEEAAEQLAQFRRAYPAYAIPRDLDR